MNALKQWQHALKVSADNGTSSLSLLELTPTQGQARRNDPRSAVLAARSVDARRQRDVLLRELKATTVGRTCDELEAATGIPRYVVASRLAQMRRFGDVEPFGLRENPHGRQVQVWWPRAEATGVVDVGTKSGLL